jgi:D-beta-D-heptose 7-phosphate kinase / D-beta-D-heptose 1-phosphate adenosyltransferase
MSNIIKAIVVGDLILDSYILGEVHRISPEAPVPVLSQNETFSVLGGALNTTQNLKNLGVDAIPLGVIGKDTSGEKILEILSKEKIYSDHIYIDTNFKTSTKIRLASKNHHLLRLDIEEITSKKDWDNFFLKILENQITNIDFLLISDYGKGLCSKTLLANVIKLCNKNNINIFVDPKGTDYEKYQNSFCITPNQLEAELITGNKLLTNNDFEKAAKQIAINYGIKNCVITRGPDGLTCFDGNKTFHIKANKVDVFDVSGAGDKFISVLAYKISQNESILNSCKYANLEAGKSVKYFGTREQKN